jgi:hypothetical protein
MFDKKSSISSNAEKKEFAIFFNKDRKSPATCKILIRYIVVDYSKSEHLLASYL